MRNFKIVAGQRERRAWRVRNRIRETTARPRLSVFRSNKHIYAQIIDDVSGKTVVSASTCDGEGKAGGNVKSAQDIGKTIAAKALEQGIKEVVFDRGSYRFHGRVAALAEAARQAGLSF